VYNRALTEDEILSLYKLPATSLVSDNSHIHDDRYYTESEIGSTSVGSSGASRVGIEDSGGHFTSTNVEGALQELGANVGITQADADIRYLNESDNLSDLPDVSIARTNLGLVAVASSGDASDVSIVDSGTYYTATDVEGALAEIAGKDITLTLNGDVSGSATFTDLGDATLTTVVADDSHTHDTRYRTETELSSTTTGEGASFIGVEDAGGYYTGTDVESVLQEVGSSLSVSGGGLSITTQTGNFTPTASETLVIMNNTTAATVTLDTTLGNGTRIIVKRINTGAVTVSPSSGTIDDDASSELTQYDSITYVCDGTNWWII
jgi:hypothetical protein